MTKGIKDLEAHLGVKLFEIRRRGLKATHRAHIFLRHAKAILTKVANSGASLGGARNEMRGKLNTGVTSLTAGYVLSDILSRFRRAWPGVDVSAVEDTGEYLEHLLVGWELDVAVMIVSELRNPQALHSDILTASQFRLLLPVSHPLTSKDSTSLSDFASEPQTLLDVHEMQIQGQPMLSALGSRPRIAFKTKSVEAVRSLVASGAGVALLPDLVYHHQRPE